MPWLDDAKSPTPAVQRWKTALSNALRRRIDAISLAAPIKELNSSSPVTTRDVAEILFSFRAGNAGFDDPLLFQYARFLLKSRYTATSDVLAVLLQQSCFVRKSENEQAVTSKSGLPTLEERMITILAQMRLSGEVVCQPRQLHAVVYILARWLNAIDDYEITKQLENGALHTVTPLMYGIYEALTQLVITVFGISSFRDVAKQAWWKERRPPVVAKLENFDSHVLQWMQSQLAGRLRALTTIPPFVATGADGRPIFTAQQVLATVTDLPIQHSRAGLYIWLNACLCARPLTDDDNMLSFLRARYTADYQSLMIDLLIASFDVLTNAMLRKEPRQSIKVIRSFICNKIPLLLLKLTGSVTSMAVEACVQMAFMTIPMNPVPPISAGSNDIQEMLKRTRLEFLQACALHGLVTEHAIGIILQEPPIALPRVVRYTKEGLTMQCTTNMGRLESFVEDLESMQGNAGAVAGCIMNVIHNFCGLKDTMTLKTVCNILIKKIPDMDIVMQYTQPASLLLPLCTLLNDWTHDQDQAEFTPSYEEFATILLFVLAVCHRFGLDTADVGLATSESFAAKLLSNAGQSIPLTELTDEQSSQLSKWLEGLFSIDEQGDASGIGDEVMRQCPPQAFYLLVPTLFEQSILACKSNALTLKTFRGGLELLLEPFLLPSLVGGLTWLVQHSEEDHDDADVLMQLLDKLLKPSSTSYEVQAMHRAVLAVVATPLTHSLQTLAKRQPERKDTRALIDLLKPHLDRVRTHVCNRAGLEDAISLHEGQPEIFVRKTVTDMTAWCTSVGPGPPPRYSNIVLEAACETLGAPRVLTSLVSELRFQTALGSPNDAIALDVCTSLVCALSPSKNQPPLLGMSSNVQTPDVGLRGVLQLTLADSARLLNQAVGDAEALVRLGRRVEVQGTAVQLPQIALTVPPMQDQGANQMMADLGLTDGNASGTMPGTDAVAELMGTADSMHMDFSAVLDQPMDLSNVSAGDMDMSQTDDLFGMNMDISDVPQQSTHPSNPQQATDDDIFAGLDMLDDDFTFT